MASLQHASHAAAYHGKIAELELLSVEELMTEDTLGSLYLDLPRSCRRSVPVLKLLLERLPAGSASRKSRFRAVRLSTARSCEIELM